MPISAIASSPSPPAQKKTDVHHPRQGKLRLSVASASRDRSAVHCAVQPGAAFTISPCSALQECLPWLPVDIDTDVAHGKYLHRIRESATLMATLSQPLVMKRGVLDVHAEVDHVQDGEQYGVDDGATARAADHHEQLAIW
jgi:hypothetical protein